MDKARKQRLLGVLALVVLFGACPFRQTDTA